MVRRKYIQTSDVTGSTEDQVALAELMIDDYVGWQERHVQAEFFGQVVSHNTGTKTIADTSNTSQLAQINDYYVSCVVEIIGGTGIGAVRNITGSSKDGKSITYTGDVLGIDTTSVFKVYQLAKFPRKQDIYSGPNGLRYYKPIPEAVKDAVKAQTEFIISQGDEFFAGVSTDYDSERIGNYSYTRGNTSGSTSGSVKMIAPKARAFLRGIKNSRGGLVAENPTWL